MSTRDDMHLCPQCALVLDEFKRLIMAWAEDIKVTEERWWALGKLLAYAEEDAP